MSHYVCSVYGTGACLRCLDLNSFRYRSYLHFRMWQRPEYREVTVNRDYASVLESREQATALGQQRLTCLPPCEGSHADAS